MDLEKTENLRSRGRVTRELDALDRKILGTMTRDATLSYAAIGKEVGLSAPAIHERVKRLRAGQVIKATTAQIDGVAVGKPLLAFVHVDTIGWGKTQGIVELERFPEVEEIHTSTGDTCLILKVRVASSLALEGLLSEIYDIEGVRSTRTYMALSTVMERTAQPGISSQLEKASYAR